MFSVIFVLSRLYWTEDNQLYFLFQNKTFMVSKYVLLLVIDKFSVLLPFLERVDTNGCFITISNM